MAGGMDSANITFEQADRLFVTVARMLEYEHRLMARMQALSFPPDDPLYRAGRNATMTLRELYLTVNDHRRKGVQRRALRRAQAWPVV